MASSDKIEYMKVNKCSLSGMVPPLRKVLVTKQPRC